MQLLRDPQPLALLRRQRAADAVAPLGLEPVEHVVERRGELGGLGVPARDLEPAARLEWVDPPRERRQLAQRRQRTAQQQEVEREHQREAADEDRELAHGEVRHGRREDQRGDRAGGSQHRRVADGDAPEESRTPSSVRTRPPV